MHRYADKVQCYADAWCDAMPMPMPMPMPVAMLCRCEVH
jgi:hypothetical protein